MRILFLLIIFTGCSMIPDSKDRAKNSYQERVRECVVEFIGKYGVEITKANTVCQDIYKGK